ncbi:MAG: hypothetical protein ABL904_17140 [Hyphomicrobiaceae bacterium]
MRDIYSQLKTVQAIAPAVYTADTTPAAIDLQGFNAALISISNADGGIAFDASNKIEITATHSDDGVTYTNVADADLLGVTGTASGIVKSFIAAATAGITNVGYIGNKRFLKVKADFTGTHGTGTGLAVTVVLGHPAIAPVA